MSQVKADYITVTMHVEDKEDRVVSFRNFDGEELAIKMKGGTVCDLREKPPFLPMSPCPYCLTLHDKGHIAGFHINPSLGQVTRQYGCFDESLNEMKPIQDTDLEHAVKQARQLYPGQHVLVFQNKNRAVWT